MSDAGLQPAVGSFNHSNATAAKRARDSKSPASDSRKGAFKRQRQGSTSLVQFAGGHELSGSAQSSLLLCLHALTHCTEQLKQQTVVPGQDGAQLLSDIATAAGRLQRVARQRLQLLQTPAADAAVQHTVVQQGAEQHDLRQQPSSHLHQIVVEHQTTQASAVSQDVQQQRLASRSNTHKPLTVKASRQTKQQQQSQQQQQQRPLVQPVKVKTEPVVHAQDISWQHEQQQQPQHQQTQAMVKLPPAPAAVKQPRSQASQHGATAAALWQVDKQPYAFQQAQHGVPDGNKAAAQRRGIPSDSSSSRAAAALEAALAAAAAEADGTVAAQADNSSRATGRNDHQQQQTLPPAVHLPALKPVSQLPRDRLKNLASAVAGRSTAAGDTAAGDGRVSKGPGRGCEAASDKQVANRPEARPIVVPAAAAVTARYTSDKVFGTVTQLSSESADSGSSSSDSSGSSSSEGSDADSDAELPLSLLQDKHAPRKQQQHRDNTAFPPPAAAEGPQQCLVCGKVWPAEKLVCSKLFCSCKSCLTAAVQNSSRRGYRLAQCPKRGCNTMVVKLGKAGWHTGSSGQAHYVEVDSKTGLFRIGYTRKRSKERRKVKKGVKKGASSSRNK